MKNTTTAAEVLRPINVRQLGALKHQQRLALVAAAAFSMLLDRTTPDESGSRIVAAHHEAGHVVVAAALGYSIDSVRVERHPALGLWAGRTAHHFSDEQRGSFLPAEKPAVAERIASVDLAGFIAEARITRPLNPKSSVDERFRAALTCAALDDAAGCAVGTTLVRVINRVHTIIGRNVTAFDAMVGLLMRETQPDPRQLAAALVLIEVSCEFTRAEGV